MATKKKRLKMMSGDDFCPLLLEHSGEVVSDYGPERIQRRILLALGTGLLCMTCNYIPGDYKIINSHSGHYL